MATTLTSTTNFDKTVTTLVLRNIAENLRKRAHWLDEGSWLQATQVPGTNMLRYIAYGDLSTVAQALTEATPPAEDALTIAYDEFYGAQYGRLVGISDIALMQSPHNLAAVAAERLAFNAIMTLDRSIGEAARDYITAPSTIFAHSHTARVQLEQASTDYLTMALVRRAVTELRAANVPTFADGTYHAKIHPYAARDLMEESGTAGQWLDVNKYTSTNEIKAGEIGTMHGVKFMETNNGTYIGNGGAASAQIFRTIIYGPGFYAFGDFDSIEAYMVRPGGDHTDPLGQKMLMGWKGFWGSQVLDIAGVGPKFRGIDHTTSAAAAG